MGAVGCAAGAMPAGPINVQDSDGPSNHGCGQARMAGCRTSKSRREADKKG